MASAIQIEGLHKSYRRTPAVRGVSLAVDEGEAFGYLGPNGAGKTTTIRCLLGLVTPNQGRLVILGHDVANDLTAALGELGYLPGEFGLWPQMTGRECLSYLGSLHPRPPVRRQELLERFELGQADLDRHVRFYSRGMKQKVGIVQAFQHDPAVAILDEPTEGLDPLMKERFVELLAEHTRSGGTILLSSHILSEVEEVTTRVGVIREGRLIRVGPTRDLTGRRLRYCTLRLKGDADVSALASLDGVSAFRPDHGGWRFEFRGDMEPLMRLVGALPVQELLVEPERLADAFFDVYGGASR